MGHVLDLSTKAAPRWADRHPFVLFQGVTWALLSATAFLPALGRVRGPWSAFVGWVSAWTLTGVAVSTLIALSLSRLSEQRLRGARTALLTMAVAIVGGALWVFAMWALEPLVGRDPFAPPSVATARYLTMSLLRGAILLGLWTALFLVNLLSARMQRAREMSVLARAAAHQAQLQLLRSQLNPHFLFNALNSVVGLIGENPRAAQAMVRDVAQLLRRSLDSDTSREVTVAQELEFIRLYLKCEKVRFEERLQVSYDVADGVEDLKVPSMLLHPLVENAVKHGMQGACEGPLSLRVSVQRGARGLVFEVANTGSLERDADAVIPPSTGIGLRNVRERLSQLFPEQHAFELSERDGWVVARLELPVRAEAP
jgi:two-component system LytT family sensor kinase